MLEILNSVRGYVRITVKGFFPERFLNICAKRGILLWDIKRTEKMILNANVSIEGFKKLRPIAKKSRCTVKIQRKKGFPFYMKNFKKRKGFFLGAALFAVIVYSMTLFVWIVDIKGNKTVSNEEVMKILEENGLYVGRFKFFIDTENLKSVLMSEMPSLSYAAVNIKGTEVEINVREREILPEEYDRNTPTNIVALRSGVIEKINTQGGMQLVKKGDAVVEGELLVSGIVTTANGVFMRYENSDAEIMARTWHEFEFKTPYKKEELMYTGEEKTKHSLKILNFNINFFIKDGISYQNYDIIESSSGLKLMKNVSLPVWHNKKTYRETEKVTRELTKEQVIEEQKQKLKAENPTLEVISVTEETDGETTKLTFECIENIVKEKNLVQEETYDNRENIKL